MSLAETRENLIDVLEEHLSILAAPYPIGELGRSLEETARAFQGLGCVNLLLYADPARFQENLVQSAFARRWYLRRSASEGNTVDEHLAISRVESVFDAVAAGAFDVAREVVALSPTAWMPAGEYEDDFCYYAFFHALIRADLADPVGQGPLVERLEAVLAGAPSPRLTLCKAFLLGDHTLFADGLAALLDGREAEVDVQALSDDPTVEPRRSVFVEALALLRLADDAGFSTDAEYRYCPRFARVPPIGRLPTDIFAAIDREFPRL